MNELDVHYYCAPTGELTVDLPIEFIPVQEFLADEIACKALWDLISVNFRTRSKFPTVWPNVRSSPFITGQTKPSPDYSS
jgi:hypothetical protein